MQPGRRANMPWATQHSLGTMSGVIAAYLLAVITAGAWQREFLVGFAIATPFLWHLAFAQNYALGVAVLSFWILVLLDLAAPPEIRATTLFMSRLADTAIGCALALAANLLIEEQTKRAGSPGHRTEADRSGFTGRTWTRGQGVVHRLAARRQRADAA